jgi:beta-glucosidase
MRLGMFDPADRVPFANIPYEVNDSPEHHAIALDTTRKSIVLLKNADNLLPLPADISSIAVIGPNANDDHVLLANYFGQPSVSSTPLEGIRAAVSAQTKVWTTPGCKRTGTKVDGVRNHANLSEAVSMAQRAAVTVLCLGLSAELEGEQDDIGATDVGGDKGDLKLTGLQQRLMEEIVALGKPVVLVLMAGSPMDISWAQDNVGAILDVWYPGPFGGTALADVLFGKVSPAGRLPVTFPRGMADIPAFANYDMTGRTYRFSSKTPLYPFGYGLSYASFSYANLASSTANVSPSAAITVSVRVANTSQRDSDEVVQLYVEHLTPGADRVPLRELRGFERVHVPAGQAKDVSFSVTAKDLSVIDDQGRRQLRPGKFRLHVGGSQPDARSAELTGKSPLHLDVNYDGKITELPY